MKPQVEFVKPNLKGVLVKGGSEWVPEKGMGDRIYEVLERPQSPSEAVLHHKDLELERRIREMESRLDKAGL